MSGGLRLELPAGDDSAPVLAQGDNRVRVELANARELIAALADAAADLTGIQVGDYAPAVAGQDLDQAPELLTTDQAAEQLGVTRRTVQGWIQPGLLPTVETPIKSGSGTVSLIPTAALATFERPKVGYPKGRPRKPDPDGGDDDQEVTE